MPIRPAQYFDLTPAAKCLARAFFDEGLWGQYMHPNRNEHPEDVYLTFLHKLRQTWASGPDNHILVSFTTDEHGTETITGIAHWTRMRAQPRTSLLTKAGQSVISWYNWAESFIYPNRAVDPVHVGILSEFGPFMQHFWTGSRAEVWDLTLLGVDPAAHGNGHGKQLASWGFEKAKEEGIGCSVVASEGKSGFYQKCGFDVVAGDAKDEGGMRNPLNRENIPGGAILFWDNGRSPGHVQMSTLK